MAGNLSEMLEDRWHTNYKGAPVDGSAWVFGNDARRVHRGGDWSGYRRYGDLATMRRQHASPGRYTWVGFRCSKTLNTSTRAEERRAAEIKATEKKLAERTAAKARRRKKWEICCQKFCIEEFQEEIKRRMCMKACDPAWNGEASAYIDVIQLGRTCDAP